MSDDTRDQDRVGQLMERVGFAVLATRDGGKFPARPM